MPLRHWVPRSSSITSSTLRPTQSLDTPAVLPAQPPTNSTLLMIPSSTSMVI